MTVCKSLMTRGRRCQVFDDSWPNVCQILIGLNAAKSGNNFCQIFFCLSSRHQPRALLSVATCMFITCVPLPAVLVTVALPAGGDALPGGVALELLPHLAGGGAAHVGTLVAPVRAVLVSVTHPQTGDTLPRPRTLELLLRTPGRFEAVIRLV